MKKKYILTAITSLFLSVSSCGDFLDQVPDKILTNDQVYGDPNLIESVLSNFYERISWGQHAGGEIYDYTRLDEAIRYDRDEVNQFDRNRWREYDYGLVRNINQFLQGLKESTALKEEDKAPLASEARLIRAWYYFCSCRGLGGMPIVGDEVFDYVPGMDITLLQKPRATEAEMYDYVISECRDIAGKLSDKTTTNSARANKWTAKMLEARAALYAASIAKYNNGNSKYAPLTTSGGEIGIPASKAKEYYEIALAAAKEVVENSPYILQDKRPEDKAKNFYEAVCVKDNNTEVIWARDFLYPSQAHGFTRANLPTTLAQEAECSYLSVLLNLVEEFEPINTPTPGKGSKFVTGTLDNPIFYETADAPFKDRDPRLGGTVIYPGSSFTGAEVVLQAGRISKINNKWEKKEGSEAGEKDAQGNLITSSNGPVNNSTMRLINKTGFNIRKFLDETPAAGTYRGSEMWEPRFRIAEAYMIAAEASLELNGGTDANTVKYINAVRTRAGVQPLTVVTFDNIVHEKRVEFAFEDHRYWDMKRWRLADVTWTGNMNDETASRRGLWPYRVLEAGDPNNEKWFFEVRDMSFIYPNPLRFEPRHYYCELDNGWLNNNPKLVKNPYQ